MKSGIALVKAGTLGTFNTATSFYLNFGEFVRDMMRYDDDDMMIWWWWYDDNDDMTHDPI